jgi:hypothetical protein
MYLEWPNRFWSVSLDLTLFLDFLNFFVKMRLRISFVWAQISWFYELPFKSYGCLKFWAGFGQGGHVLEPMTRSWPHVQKIWAGRKKNLEFRAPVQGRLRLDISTIWHSVETFWFFWFFFGNLEEVGGWAWHLGRMGVQHPHFLKHAPTLGSVKSSICHGH